MSFYHPVELVEMAAGGHPAHAHEERAWDIMAIISNHLVKYALFPSYRKSFQPAYISPEIQPLPELPRGDRVRMKALAAMYHSPVIQNKIMRAAIAYGFKATVGTYGFARKKRLKLPV
jgi:hypothetical protein